MICAQTAWPMGNLDTRTITPVATAITTAHG
jgi:hypothetical protein